jgi:hypothetical protein
MREREREKESVCVEQESRFISILKVLKVPRAKEQGK